MRERSLVLTLAAASSLLVTTAAVAAVGWQVERTYALPGNESKYEGIGYHEPDGTFYVSETTGGEIHRGNVDGGAATQWLPAGGDGRNTARGIDTDVQGRVYIAGGSNRVGNPALPNIWVYSPTGTLLAALAPDVPNANINDVWVAPDGAAYLTDSTNPFIYRVKQSGEVWTVTKWLDATGVIPTVAGFNLNGIVATANGRYLIVAHTALGTLWRVDIPTRAVQQIDLGGATVTGADGIALRGLTLWVVRNFPRTVATVKLAGDAASGRVVRDTPTDPDRVFTTAKVARDRLLLIDSKFDEAVSAPPYEVVSARLP